MAENANVTIDPRLWVGTLTRWDQMEETWGSATPWAYPGL